MILNIFVGVICVAAVAAGIWGVWLDNGGSFRSSTDIDTDGIQKEETQHEEN